MPEINNNSSPSETQPSVIEPLPENIKSVQPGGGQCYTIELAWGCFRRAILKNLRPGYVAKMAKLRQGSAEGAPHEILDPRDLKYCHNLCTAHWAPEHDRFRWRDKIPFARWGLAELFLQSALLLIMTCVAYFFIPAPMNYFLAAEPFVIWLLIVYFFRDPHRVLPTKPNLVLAPADGTIAEITKLEHDSFIGGPAVKIGIFLSIFNVHINRAPLAAKVLKLEYKPGEFLNAMNPESVMVNEYMWIGMQETAAPYRRFSVRQISGLIARRIVCAVKPGQTVKRGEQFGMIKLGSRTEIILPAEGLEVKVVLGQKILAGSTVFAKYICEKDS